MLNRVQLLQPHRSPLGYSVHGIFQARILERVAISSSRDLPNPGVEAGSPALQADSLLTELPGKPNYVYICIEKELEKYKMLIVVLGWG